MRRWITLTVVDWVPRACRSEETRNKLVKQREEEIRQKMQAQKLADDNRETREKEKKAWVIMRPLKSYSVFCLAARVWFAVSWLIGQCDCFVSEFVFIFKVMHS